jgi:hypothetical protein
MRKKPGHEKAQAVTPELFALLPRVARIPENEFLPHVAEIH